MLGTPTPTLSYIPYAQFLADVDAVGQRLAADHWQPDFLVGVGRGGLVPAAYLSHRTGIAMLSVDHSSGDAGFADELLVKLATKIVAGQRILIIDDINDSGGTIAALRAAIEARAGTSDNLRVAVLVNNVRSRAKAEYSAREIDRDHDKRWFVFPWEAQAPTATIAEEAVSVPERLA
jgi:xanthine phosphoribosyltransferase